MRSAVAAACALFVAALAPGRGGADEAYRAAIQEWRDAREARLEADGGWLSVAGLTWLKPGENTFGTACAPKAAPAAVEASTSCDTVALHAPTVAVTCTTYWPGTA